MDNMDKLIAFAVLLFVILKFFGSIIKSTQRSRTEGDRKIDLDVSHPGRKPTPSLEKKGDDTPRKVMTLDDLFNKVISPPTRMGTLPPPPLEKVEIQPKTIKSVPRKKPAPEPKPVPRKIVSGSMNLFPNQKLLSPWQQAVVLNEILQPPLALREKDHIVSL